MYIYIYASVQSQHAAKWMVALMTDSCGIVFIEFVQSPGLPERSITNEQRIMTSVVVEATLIDGERIGYGHQSGPSSCVSNGVNCDLES